MMIPLIDRLQSFLTLERQTGVMLDPASVTALAVAAVVFYRGFALLEEHWVRLIKNADESPTEDVDEDIELTDSEWAIIRPLFLLYLERETAYLLEASRGSGVDVYGRSVAEISGDIATVESEMAHRAFCYPIVSV